MLGEILARAVRCPCGASITARSRVVRDISNRALNTCVDLDFAATRAFLTEHRPHRDPIEARRPHRHRTVSRHRTAMRPPTGSRRDLLRLRRSLPTAVLTGALGPIFTHIDPHTLATRGAYLARRPVTDDVSAAELAAVITALRADPQRSTPTGATSDC